jgi:hypothetical protein
MGDDARAAGSTAGGKRPRLGEARREEAPPASEFDEPDRVNACGGSIDGGSGGEAARRKCGGMGDTVRCGAAAQPALLRAL